MQKKYTVIGGPGTGKTTHLIGLVDRALAAGVPPHRIAFVSYTKAAVAEAKARAVQRFGLDPRELQFFLTVHALAYRGIGVTPDEMMNPGDWREVSNRVGVPLTGRADVTLMDGGRGAQLLGVLEYSRARRISLEEAWRATGAMLDPKELAHLKDTLTVYKREWGKLDFADLLEHYCAGSSGAVAVDIAIIDEAQDLSTAQYAVVDRAFASAGEVYYAGDDDQSIYAWSGAAPERLYEQAQVSAPMELLTSHRLPRSVHAVASQIGARIRKRIPKHFHATGVIGEVCRIGGIPDLDFGTGKEQGTWMILARTNWLAARAEEELREQGVLYRTPRGSSVAVEHAVAVRAWEMLRQSKPISGEMAAVLLTQFGRSTKATDAFVPTELYTMAQLGIRFTSSGEIPPWYTALRFISRSSRDYYRNVLQRGHTLLDEPSVYVGTIHSAKGMEADTVVLLPDMTLRVAEGMKTNPDAEHRVWYVGASRARENLFIADPRGSLYYRVLG